MYMKYLLHQRILNSFSNIFENYYNLDKYFVFIKTLQKTLMQSTQAEA